MCDGPLAAGYVLRTPRPCPRFQEENDRVWPTAAAAGAGRLWQPSPDGLVGGPRQQPLDPPTAELAAYFSPAPPGPGAEDEAARGWSDESDDESELGAGEGPEAAGPPRGTPPRTIAQLPPASPLRSSWERERAGRDRAVGDVIDAEHEAAALDSALGRVRASRLARAPHGQSSPPCLPRRCLSRKPCSMARARGREGGRKAKP